MARATPLGLADYLLLLRREWWWGCKLFGLITGAGLIGVWVGWQFQPKAPFVATTVLWVSEKMKERTMAQLGSHAWAQTITLKSASDLLALKPNPDSSSETFVVVEPPLNVSLKALPAGLLRLEVETATPADARLLAERLITLLKQDRQAAWNALVPRLEILKREQAALNPSAPFFESRAQRMASEITRLQMEQADLVVEVIDPPTVTSRPAQRPMKSVLSLWGVAGLIAFSGIFVREWWRLEMRKRRGDAAEPAPFQGEDCVGFDPPFSQANYRTEVRAGNKQRHRSRAIDRPEAQRREYLGDGVYVVYDGFGFWLTAENGREATDEIYLEPETLESLQYFVSKVVSPRPSVAPGVSESPPGAS